MPYKLVPIIMITGMVTAAYSQINDLPAPSGVSDTINPSTIVASRPSPDYNVMTSIAFGTYVQVDNEPNPANTITTRTTGAIALNPVVNEQGAYYFMSLMTGKRLNRQSWTILPMGTDVIARVEKIALQQGQPLLKRGGPLFEWLPGVPILDVPPDEELPILMDAPEDYARGENFDGPVTQNLAPVGGGHLTYDDEGNPIPEDFDNNNQAHNIIPVEDNDFINNEYDIMEAPMDADLSVNTPVQAQALPTIDPILPEGEIIVASLQSTEDKYDLGEERCETADDNRDRGSAHNMSLRPRLPPPNAHRNTFEKDFQYLQKSKLCGAFHNIDSEEDYSRMYRVVTGIITRESERVDTFVETNNGQMRQQFADHDGSCPDFRGRGYGATLHSEGHEDICLA